MKIVQYMITNNDCYQNNVNKVDSRYTTFQKRGPKGLMLHSVGCAQPSAEIFAKRWNQSGYEVAVHAVLQADGTVYQCMPWNYRAWHCGGDANNTHVGVEMTEPSQIKYGGGATFTVTDKAAARKQAQGTYETAVELFAELCKKYNLNPLTDIISHNEGSKLGVASGHVDPEHLWKGLGLSYTMDGFRAAVKAKMEGTNEGWQQDDKGWRYREADGSYPKMAWRAVNGVWYFFGEDGYMLTGDHEYNGYIWHFANNGAYTGKEPIETEEDTMMTQEQFNEMMDNYLNKRNAEAGSDWSKDAREWALKEGLFQGDETGNLMWQGFMTREQFATVMQRYANKK